MKSVKGVKGMKGISAVIATILMLVITIALAGTAYMFINNMFTSQTQGLEIVDSYCTSDGKASIIVRNLGTSPVTSIACVQTAPSGDTCDSTGFTTGVSIAPQATGTFTAFDICAGTGSRFCNYRLTPNVGRTITVQVSCT